MPIIIMSKPASKLEPSLKKKAYAFLEKLGEDDTGSGLHIESIANSADNKPRIPAGQLFPAARRVTAVVCDTCPYSQPPGPKTGHNYDRSV